MKKEYYYNFGDIVEVQPYTIFTDPTPSVWNDNQYGTGKNYVEGETFEFTKSIDLYAQYDPVAIRYYLTGKTDEDELTSYIVQYDNRVGNRIQVASFPWISGFVGWLSSDGSKVDVGSYIYLTSTVELFMSCEFIHNLAFSPNGGEGEMHPLSGIQHIYIDRATYHIAVENPVVMMPSCEFTNAYSRFYNWIVGSAQYNASSDFVLSTDSVAQANWTRPTKYILNASCQLVNTDFAFSYLMLKINSTIGDLKTARFSKICFVDSSKELEFSLQPEVSTTTVGINGFGDGSGPMNGIDGSTKTNVVIQMKQRPCGIVYGFKEPILNIARYSRFQMWTASNASSHRNDIIDDFQVYVSNNGVDWFFACMYSGHPPYKNEYLMYESDPIAVGNVAVHPTFGPVGLDYKIVQYANGNGGCISIGYVPTDSTRVVIDMRSNSQYTDSLYVGFDYMQSGTSEGTDFRYFSPNSFKTIFCMGGMRSTWNNSPTADAFHTIDLSEDGLRVDGMLQGHCVGDVGTIATCSIYVFGKPGHEVDFTMKSLKVYEGSALKMEMYPAIDKAMRSCLVDLVSGMKYYSLNGTDIYCSDNDLVVGV